MRCVGWWEGAGTNTPTSIREIKLDSGASAEKCGLHEKTPDMNFVARQKVVPPVCRDDNFLPTTSPPLLRNATSPCRKDSLRPEGDVANSDRGRMTTGESVMVVLDEQSFCFRKRPGSAVEIYSSNTNAATNADRARRPAPNRAQANSRACPACQGLPYQGSCRA